MANKEQKVCSRTPSWGSRSRPFPSTRGSLRHCRNHSFRILRHSTNWRKQTTKDRRRFVSDRRHGLSGVQPVSFTSMLHDLQGIAWHPPPILHSHNVFFIDSVITHLDSCFFEKKGVHNVDWSRTLRGTFLWSDKRAMREKKDSLMTPRKWRLSSFTRELSEPSLREECASSSERRRHPRWQN